MKLNQTAFAYAHGLIGGVFYVICWLWSAIFGGSLVWIANSWVHTLDFSSLATKSLDLGTAVVGLVTWTAFAMAWGYFIAWAYNMAAKK